MEVWDVYSGNSGKLKNWSLSLARAASALNVTSVPVDANATQQPVPTASLVQPLLAEAIAHWQTAGADVSSLASLDLRISDLGGTTLGLASGNTIWLDDNAAGWGWFLDTTPWDDFEFNTPGNQGELNRIDLLTVLIHELGHVLGRDHDEKGVMAEEIAAGTRSVELEQVHVAATDLAFG